MAPSGHSAQVLQSWDNTYNACSQLYDDDKLDECIDVAESHLSDDSMPLYHRMLFELLLGGSLGDWWEVDDHIRRCEAIWHNTHAYHQNDADEMIRDGLAEIRQSLDGMQREHAMKPRSMEDPRLAEYEEDEQDEQDEQAGQEEDDDIMDGEENVVDEDWDSDEDAMMNLSESKDPRETNADEEEEVEKAITEPGEIKDIREVTGVYSSAKPGVERMPPEMVQDIGDTMEPDSSVKPGVERMPPEVEADADAKRSIPLGIVKVENSKSEAVEVGVEVDATRSTAGIVKVEDAESEMAVECQGIQD